jgi:DNA polymerase-4
MQTENAPLPTSRIIAHLDLDAFFCAVEELRDPTLRGKPFAVGGDPNRRGVVASCSYPARLRGIRSAMPMATALRLCPEMLIVRQDFSAYKAASAQVMQKIRALGVPVEQISIDEAFFDLSSRQHPAQVARQLQEEIYLDLGLPCSVGLASNKLVAKIANDVGKAAQKNAVPPRAFTQVETGKEADFLAPLPIRRLWGVGPKTAKRLAELGIRSIGDLARQDEVKMLRRFGQNGYELTRRARGIDTRPLSPKHKSKSISQERTFSVDKRDQAELLQVLRKEARAVAKNLQNKGLLAKTVKIKLRQADFTTFTRQSTLENSTNDAETIIKHAEKLFERNWDGRALRLLGVGVSGLGKEKQQLGLWDQDWEKNRLLNDMLADLQNRFGEGAIKRGVTS